MCCKIFLCTSCTVCDNIYIQRNFAILNNKICTLNVFQLQLINGTKVASPNPLLTLELYATHEPLTKPVSHQIIHSNTMNQYLKITH